jgi:predicted RNA-binding Zn-ribbon protein involved in translation (DUF1610 family)
MLTFCNFEHRGTPLRCVRTATRFASTCGVEILGKNGISAPTVLVDGTFLRDTATEMNRKPGQPMVRTECPKCHSKEALVAYTLRDHERQCMCPKCEHLWVDNIQSSRPEHKRKPRV